jgi:hypothetical protein
MQDPTLFTRLRTSAALLGCVASLSNASTLIDFDMPNRSVAEGLEPGYTEWIVTETTGSASTTVDGIKFTVSRNGGAGTGIKSYYYKAGVQSPNFARLVCDALSVVDGDAGASIRVAISGMSSGSHSLLVYHNGIDGNQHANIKVVVNGTTAISSQAQTNEVLTTGKAAFSYVTFSGTSATIDYTSIGSGSYNNVFLDNLSLDVPNPALQAGTPSPTDQDMHVDCDAGSVTLSWKDPSGTKSRDVYVGTDSASVAKATKSSAEFKGNQTTSSWVAKNLSKLSVYWWRIDEIDASGMTTPGSLWHFAPRRLAFPQAEGYGRYARGGHGGKVVHVTNLNDDGAGSYRDAAANQTGPRTIVFDVGGIISLTSRVVVSDPDVTVAGQTAPGKGICFRYYPVGFESTDLVVRFVKMRLGFTDVTNDGIEATGADQSIFDHLSDSWTIDEAFSSRSAQNITLQRSLISEALNDANHTNAAGQVDVTHGYAGTISGKTGSYHHNLDAHCAGRNFSMGSALDGTNTFASKLDISNNVFYNWYDRATDGQAHEVNFINNYYKMGAATKLAQCLSIDFENYGSGTMTAYYAGDILQGTDGKFKCDGTDNTCGRKWTTKNGDPGPTWDVFPTSGPLFTSYINLQPAKDAYKDVLSDVGQTMPVLDDHDQRVIHETYTGTYKYKGSITGLAGLPDRETDVGGWESYPTTSRASNFDTDGDGLPDWYEAYLGTNPNSSKGDFSDANADPVGDGYTNLERYLEYMATPHQETKAGTAATFNLNALFRGYQGTTPTYKAGTNSCLTTSIKDSTLTVTPTSACGIVALPLTVTDKEGSTKTRDVDIFVTGSTTTGIVAQRAPGLEWMVRQDRIGVRTEVAGVLVVRDLSGRFLAQASGTGAIGIDARGLPSRTLVVSFDAEGLHERKVLSALR